MRIAMVSEHASPLAALGGVDAGGQNVYVARLSEELARRGHDVTVYTRRDSAELPDRVALPGGAVVEHVPAGPPAPVPKDELFPYMDAFGAHLGRVWDRERPDVVHAHFWMSGLAARAGARPHHLPVVQTFHALGTVKRRHQGHEDTSPPERVGLERQIGRGCARVLATCTDEVHELADMGVPPRRVSVVPCGVDVGHFRPGASAADTPARRERHRLLACGRLVRRKGYDQAIRALTQIPDTELVVAGGPPPQLLDAEPEARRLLRLAEQLGLADRVRLLGAVDPARMPALIGSADAVLCTPTYEPFGIVPLEAMACGVPVVATDVGGHRDTVSDGVTGRLVPAGDLGAIAEAVRDVLADARLRRTLGAAGRERALARYTWQRVADGVEEVYERVTARDEMPSEVA
ncbi:glycosyltransferase [Streptomyces canus]|uniref:D-inositol 3-phosphate glycosyltransferase n=1 Tax=Streptomyces canus TaxID=58343 RepID=A0AAW8FX68_9ACTN|nr:glycosyltransferase [Streptomyces canus]MDQ0757698.1 D-inositol-3-phosphate glycosyltransferase [Streptomyces canus]MDQ0913627.1 D-inositol-3-phosphate glycosyltransferase [Streptomyces canus]MDQ1073611.1 D-inositol-3-phosphate glycosyltransferase [Streptomyces canus]